MKIAKKDLERLVLEELEASLDEGIFSQVGAGLKGAASQLRGAAKDVGGAVKQAAGKVAGAYQTGKAAQKEKEKASSSQQAILRIAAEILANPQASGVSEQNTQGLWKVIKHYAENPPSGTRSRFSPAALVREEDNIEEATEREIRTELSLLQKAIKDGIVSIKDIERDVRRLVRTNPVARAIPGASEMEPKVLQPKEEPVAVQPVQQPVQQPAAAGQPPEPSVPDVSRTSPTPESDPEKEKKAQKAADNIMGQIASAINSASVSQEAKKKVKASTEKARQAVAREIRAGLQEQKDRWQELAGILKD